MLRRRADSIGVDIRPVPPQSLDARRLLADYLDDLERRLDGWVRAGYVDATPDELLPPAGALLVGYEEGEAVACGAVRVIAPGIAEVKRMFVVPRLRGRGLGRELLDALERAAVELGCGVARLDSTEPLAEAMALYRSVGYVEIGDYNQNPNATTWLERRLRQPPGTPS
jgi:GNAT superfamily N-acetyltransferase